MKKEKKCPETVEAPLEHYTWKRWLVALLLGVCIGLAVIIPGVSGSTIAIIFSLYAGMLYAFGHILGDFKRCFLFLLPIGIGVVVGFAAGFVVIQRYFEAYMFQIVCLFVGLMIGAIPALTKELRGEKVTPLRGILLPIGILIPLAVGALAIVLSAGADSAAGGAVAFSPVRAILYLPLGALVAATQIIPGLSATAILMAFGQFQPILDSLHREYLMENPLVLILYACLGIGFLGGLVLISRGFSVLLEKHKGSTFFFVCGLAFGSIASMFLNPDMWATYTAWAKGTESPILPLAVGGGLLVVGFVASFLLTRYELKRQK